MARFVEVCDGYDITHVNPDLVTRVHANPGGYTVCFVDGAKLEIPAGDKDDKNRAAYYTWEDASKVVDEILGKSDVKADAVETQASAPVDDGKVYKTQDHLEIAGIGSRAVWVDTLNRMWFVGDNGQHVFPVMALPFGDELAHQMGFRVWLAGDYAVEGFYLGAPDASRTPSVVPLMFRDQFTDPVELLYTLQAEVDRLRSHLSDMNGDLISVSELKKEVHGVAHVQVYGEVRNDQGDC